MKVTDDQLSGSFLGFSKNGMWQPSTASKTLGNLYFWYTSLLFWIISPVQMACTDKMSGYLGAGERQQTCIMFNMISVICMSCLRTHLNKYAVYKEFTYWTNYFQWLYHLKHLNHLYKLVHAVEPPIPPAYPLTRKKCPKYLQSRADNTIWRGSRGFPSGYGYKTKI